MWCWVNEHRKLGSFFGIEVNAAEHRYHAEEEIEGRFGEQALRADLVDEAVLGEDGQCAADQTEPKEGFGQVGLGELVLPAVGHRHHHAADDEHDDENLTDDF